ncbi:MAG TPA: hypothetical protein VFC44_00465, partial [Candidatus Saccharimonadales bacterium]|nr:hypothetical protein [Candidatus Saccharimonadales bacterium]
LAELGGGKVLNPQTDNPFLHDRQKTFQPLDLRDWLLKFAILLFPFDVAVRRIQLDATQWLQARKTLRRWLVFWKPAPRKAEADESLSALLNRREQVRSSTADLFRPAKAPEIETPTSVTPAAPAPPAAETKEPPKPPGSTASRLLEAKRRAQKRTDRE